MEFFSAYSQSQHGIMTFFHQLINLKSIKMVSTWLWFFFFKITLIYRCNSFKIHNSKYEKKYIIILFYSYVITIQAKFVLRPNKRIFIFIANQCNFYFCRDLLALCGEYFHRCYTKMTIILSTSYTICPFFKTNEKITIDASIRK